MRKLRAPTSEDVARNAQRSAQRFSAGAISRRLGIGGRPIYFYVYGRTPEGKTVVWLIESLEEADAAARGLIEGEVFELETRDLHKATQSIKAEMLSRGKEIDKVLGRVSHKRLEME
jgi:hypothetical protein